MKRSHKYNTECYYLGKLCNNNHYWGTSDFSLRYIIDKKCTRCKGQNRPDISKEEYIEYFLNEILKTDSCWLWKGRLNTQGYGISKRYKYQYAAHRISYLLFNGELERGKVICHTCDNPKCVNPFHLFQGTHKDNFNDMLSKNRESWGVKALLNKEKVIEVLY